MDRESGKADLSAPLPSRPNRTHSLPKTAASSSTSQRLGWLQGGGSMGLPPKVARGSWLSVEGLWMRHRPSGLGGGS